MDAAVAINPATRFFRDRSITTTALAKGCDKEAQRLNEESKRLDAAGNSEAATIVTDLSKFYEMCADQLSEIGKRFLELAQRSEK